MGALVKNQYQKQSEPGGNILAHFLCVFKINLYL